MVMFGEKLAGISHSLKLKHIAFIDSKIDGEKFKSSSEYIRYLLDKEMNDSERE